MIRYALIMFLVLGIVEAVELPESATGKPNDNPAIQDQQEQTVRSADVAIWQYLNNMGLETKKNAEIELSLGNNASPAAQNMVNQIEDLWNRGDFESALSLFPQLERLTDIRELSIGITWRKPIIVKEKNKWSNDVRIGTRDSIYVNVLDIHRASGNLFAILLYRSGPNYYWSVNLSTNGGSTWAETFQFGAAYRINDLSATVVDTHCFVAYTGGTGQTDARLRQFKVTNGLAENFSNGRPYINVFSVAGDSIKEVALTSNQDGLNNRLYYFAICYSGTLHFLWDDPQAVSWTDVDTYITDADRGLDASFNEGYERYYLIASYINTSNQVKVIAKNPGKSAQNESGNFKPASNR